MKWTSAASLGLAATAMAAAPPAGCSTSRDGKFQVSIYSLGNAKRDLEKRACEGEGTLVMTLNNGVLKDSHDRTGYIASNYQFQFDAPPQHNAIKSSGFSVCQNGSLALDGSTVFYRCLSGNFYNLYDRHWAAQCSPIEIVATSCTGGNTGGNGGNGGNGGKPVGTSMVQTTIVTVIADGQPQIHTTVIPIPMCQIGDGQVQVRTTPCASVPAPTMAPPVSQISDGQIQAPPKTAAPPPPVSQIGDGQPQAPTHTQAPPPPPVSQISDGQPQAPTHTQAPPPPPPPVTQISDGQPQAPTNVTTGPTAVPTAAANKVFPGFAAAVVAIFGAALYL
ncbi:covalently-linked cell wall protein [Pochonia chlamydosporia 170]|uniref:Covalently-linked cell wall protein n=1 Tax=Pochonia chlamydosporia 170 TaxID=1380566 RepID=A0A179G8S3_METCM|nr:covalently-linked cell wall protein [Pochonia chlamydosporia 170]OAQ74202.1 covalently-linked cell wall protein [Pochonia chlamydosporia 170]